MNITVDLKPLDSRYQELLRTWRNQWVIWRWTRQNDLISDVEQKDWFERQAKDPSIRMYLVEMSNEAQKVAVGVCGLTSLDFANRRAEFSLYIGPEYQKKGLGKSALTLLLQHGFQNLGLNVIWGETFDGNPAAKMFESLGLVREGTRRQFYWKDGKYVDAHLYSVTREEWEQRSLPSSASCA